MDRSLQERLVGAAVLVALGVWLIPWVLDGSAVDDVSDAERVALKLPVPERNGAAAAIRRETIDLRTDRGGVKSLQRDAAAADGAAAQTAALQPDSRSQTAADTAPDAASASGADGRSVPAEAAAATPRAQTAAVPQEGADTAGAATREPESDAAAAARDGAPTARGQEAAGETILAAAPVDGWMVQTGSFTDAGNARRQAQRIGTYGHEARIYEFAAAGGRRFFRVRLGPVETRERAEAARSALAAHGFTAQLIAPD